MTGQHAEPMAGKWRDAPNRQVAPPLPDEWVEDQEAHDPEIEPPTLAIAREPFPASPILWPGQSATPPDPGAQAPAEPLEWPELPPPEVAAAEVAHTPPAAPVPDQRPAEGHFAGPAGASLIAGTAALRPAEGKRRLAGEAIDPAAWESPKRAAQRQAAQEAEGRRRAQHDDGVLIDAADAAAVISRYAQFWTAEQILSHPEIARMAVAEAQRTIVEAEKEGDKSRFVFGKKGKERKAEMERRVAELWHAAELLAEAHSKGLVIPD